MTDLAKRAVACRHWRWMPGMLGLSAKAGLWRVERADLTALSGAGAGPASIHEVGAWLPDLTDPATLGCLLALVREALDIPYLCTSVSPEGRWWVDGYSLHDTEAEALVAALEAAP